MIKTPFDFSILETSPPSELFCDYILDGGETSFMMAFGPIEGKALKLYFTYDTPYHVIAKILESSKNAGVKIFYSDEAVDYIKKQILIRN